ncbi:MAG: hypothetical protein ACLQPD_34625 [Desulfomonilaceae bacterium]
MEFSFLSEAIVILANAHNPSILHPSFLKTQHIVPEEWEALEPPICTPPFSIIKYPEGIVFTSAIDKFQIMKTSPTSDLTKSRLPEYAAKYVQVLPHVPYLAVGINFSVAIASSSPDTMIIERFLVEGPWKSNSLTLRELQLIFVYSIEGGVLNLSCRPSKPSDGLFGGTAAGIVVNGNYDFQLGEIEPAKRAEEVISTFYNRAKHFEEVLKTIFEN